MTTFQQEAKSQEEKIIIQSAQEIQTIEEIAQTLVFWDVENIALKYKEKIEKEINSPHKIISAINERLQDGQIIKDLKQMGAEYKIVKKVKNSADNHLYEHLKMAVGRRKIYGKVKEVVLISNDKELIKRFKNHMNNVKSSFKLIYTNKKIKHKINIENKKYIPSTKSQQEAKIKKVLKIPKDDLITPYNNKMTSQQKLELKKMFEDNKNYIEENSIINLKITGLAEEVYTQIFLLSYLSWHGYAIAKKRKQKIISPTIKLKNNIWFETVSITSNKIESKLKKHIMQTKKWYESRTSDAQCKVVLAINYSNEDAIKYTFEEFKNYIKKLLSDQSNKISMKENKHISGIIFLKESFIHSQEDNLDILHNIYAYRRIKKNLFKKGFGQRELK